MVVASHGIESPYPVFCYGSRGALELWELEWVSFVCLESRFTAEPTEREERARLLEAVSENGFIDNYSGFRVSSTGNSRFRIHNATIWNVATGDGQIVGQAVMFPRKSIEQM